MTSSVRRHVTRSGRGSRSPLIEVWHNVLWSRYKGLVFSGLATLAGSGPLRFEFVQHAETEGDRMGLGAVDLSYHRYSFDLLFRGSLDEVPAWRLVCRVITRNLKSSGDFVIIAGYSRLENWAQLITLMAMGKPRGVFCDSTLYDRKGRWLRSAAKRFFFRRCQLVFCYGERAKELVLSHGGNPESIVTRCQAAALPTEYDASTVVRQRVLYAPPEPVLLYVGRLSPEKNLSALLRAFTILWARYPAAKLRLVGSGPEEAMLIEQARSLKVGEAVVFAGPKNQRELAQEYLHASFLVLPSLSEPWGLVINEALSYGCPALVSEFCGCAPELIEPGGVGLTFDPRDDRDLGEKMSLMLSTFNRTAESAERCLARIADFTPERAANQIYGALATYFGAEKSDRTDTTPPTEGGKPPLS